MNRAAIYARVSSERQRERHTIASQLSILPTIIQQKGYRQVADPYVDDGISGETIEDRPAVTRLLEDAERHRFDAVFVIDLDRLTRSQKSIDWEIIKDAFRKGRVKLITPNQEYDFENEDQEFISDLFSRISAYEKKKIVRRMTRGKWEKVRQGKFVGGKVPYGYAIDEETKTYHIVEAEAAAIRLIFRLCVEGYSLERIQEQMNALGYPTPVDVKGYNHRRTSNHWAKSSIRKILVNKRYIGEFPRWTLQSVGNHRVRQRAESEWLIAKIPAIISQTVFDRAQEALKSRKALAKRNAKRPYLLSGLIYCTSCGTKMVGECDNPNPRKRKKTETRYYVCWNGRRKILDKDCPTRSIQAATIEQAVWDEVTRLLKTPALLKQAILQSETPSSSPNEETLEILTRLMEEKETEEERLLDLYQIGTVNREKLERRLEGVRRKQETIRQNIALLKNRTQLASRLKTIQELSLELKADIDTFDFAHKQRILKLLFWGQPGIGIFLNHDRSVELKGLVDFSQFKELDHFGIETTTSGHCARRWLQPLMRV